MAQIFFRCTFFLISIHPVCMCMCMYATFRGFLATSSDGEVDPSPSHWHSLGATLARMGVSERGSNRPGTEHGLSCPALGRGASPLQFPYL